MDEFEKQDQELEQLVNNAERTAECGANPPDPELVEARKQICDLEWRLKAAEDRAEEAEEMYTDLVERKFTTIKVKRFLGMLLKVLLCAAVSVAFAAILARPEYVAPVAHLGIVIAGAVAAVQVDRFIKRY